MNKNNYEINVLVGGKPVKEYYHDKNNKFFVEAKNNSEYSIKIKNHGYKKIMAVLSVDGIEVLKGGAASEAESGYIINPFSSIEIKGYRIDDDNVATFKFSDGKTSYATQVEQKFDKEQLEEVKKGNIAPAQNNGVIGVRIWEEKDSKFIEEWALTPEKINNHWFYRKHSAIHNINYAAGNFTISGYGGMGGITGCFYSNSSDVLVNCSGFSANSDLTSRSITTNNNSFASNDISQFGKLMAVDSVAITPNFQLGTTWGNKIEDKVIKVKFNKSDTYIDLELFYLTREEMVRIGIDFEKTKKVFVSGFPKAFAKKEEEYCKQPNDWRVK